MPKSQDPGACPGQCIARARRPQNNPVLRSRKPSQSRGKRVGSPLLGTDPDLGRGKALAMGGTGSLLLQPGVVGSTRS